ncbi:IS200/IS605 family transposase [Leptospira sp. 201903071]|uniref:IS200/IS605 family transposase n=1 Tax=Leptospira ainazelensis TaxID=2810034 RepID=UPI001964AC71|nr:IS200/IS605 family transposase [Leptospira ainazelensis]MBM9501286.1 IS200/IS605 family transposase [Leptospira ainazelensis]
MKSIPIRSLRKNYKLPQSVSSNEVHLIFETKEECPWLNPHLMTQIRNLFREKAEELKVKIFLVNGTKNQVHALLSVPPTIGLASVVRRLKGYSSRILGKNTFWKKGYRIQTVGDKDFHSAFRFLRNRVNRSEAHNVDRDFKKTA